MSRQPEDEFRDVIDELRRSAPEPPPVHWGAYRAELREKLERRRGRTWAAWTWRPQPIQAVIAAGFVAVLVYIGLPGDSSMPSDPVLMENAVLASRLDVIDHLEMVQKLDVLEDFDVIRNLDKLPGRGEG
ncbi:MAG TPA: hypothetical protein VMI34_03940 [Candidatus Bathyarchaeia archaeon]|nr:hypothetical protein [Candidatus Bathyarchaeia archaeon]